MQRPNHPPGRNPSHQECIMFWLKQMLEDRSWKITYLNDKKMSLPNPPSYAFSSVHLLAICQEEEKREDNKQKEKDIVVCYENQTKCKSIGVGFLFDLMNDLQQMPRIQRMILVVKSKITPQAKKKFAQFQTESEQKLQLPLVRWEFFSDDFFSYNPIAHVGASFSQTAKSWKVFRTEEEIQEAEKKIHTPRDKWLPRCAESDVIYKWLGLLPGTFLMLMDSSNTAGWTPKYIRIIQSPPMIKNKAAHKKEEDQEEAEEGGEDMAED
jgi:hypothetical protein